MFVAYLEELDLAIKGGVYSLWIYMDENLKRVCALELDGARNP